MLNLMCSIEAKKPLGGPAYVENRNRSVSSSQRDLGDFNDGNLGEGSEYGDGLTAVSIDCKAPLYSGTVSRDIDICCKIVNSDSNV